MMEELRTENRLTSLETNFQTWMEQTAEDRRETKKILSELKDISVTLVKSSFRTDRLEQDHERLEKEVESFKKNLSAIERIGNSLSWLSKGLPWGVGLLIIFVLGLGWLDLQLGYIHSRDMEQITHMSKTVVPYNPPLTHFPTKMGD